MKHSRIAIAAAVASIALVAAAPASAVQLQKRSDGSAYTGDIVGTLKSGSSIVFSSSLRNVTCNQSSLGGSAVSDGSDADVSSASFAYNGGNCQNSDSGTTQIVGNTPWNNGSFTHSTLTLANVSTTTHGSDGLDCNWVGSGAGNSITLSLKNGTSDLEAAASSDGFSRASGSEFLCPSSATMSGTYVLRTAAGEALKVVR
jgi:hypothetical protein